MNSLSNRPILFAVVILILFTISLINPYVGLVVIVLGIWLIRHLKLDYLAGIDYSKPYSNKWLSLLPSYIILIGIIQLFGFDFSLTNPKDVLVLLFETMVIGFTEEIVFRGILQSNFVKKYAAKKNGLYIGILLPSILFGCLHLLNLTDPEMQTIEVITQVVYAIFIGIGFGAILLKTKRLLPIAIIHGLINFVFGIETINGVDSLAQTTILDNLLSVLITLPMLILGIYLIRTIKIESSEHTG